MKVEILTPEWNKAFESPAVFLPGVLGQFEVLEGHAPIISTLTPGDVIWRTPQGEQETLAVKGGLVRVGRGEMQICAEV